MDPYIPSAHPFLSKNSGEMLKVRPGPHIPLERTRHTFEAPISVSRNTVRAPSRAENLPVLPLYSELEPRKLAPLPTPRKVPDVRTSEPAPIQTQEAHVPVFKSMGGEDNESSTFDLPKLNSIPAFDVGANLQPATGFKSEGGDLHLLSKQNMEPFVPKFGFKSEGGGIYPLIPHKMEKAQKNPEEIVLVPKPGFKSEGGDALVHKPVVPEAPVFENSISAAPSTPDEVLVPVLLETLGQLQSHVTLESPGIPLVASPTTPEPLDILAPVLMETLEQLKSRETSVPESLSAPAVQEVSLSDFYKGLIEEARTAPEEVAPVEASVAQPDTIDTQWSNLSTKPEEEVQASASVLSIHKLEMVDQEQEQSNTEQVTEEEAEATATVEFIYPSTHGTIQIEPQEAASIDQKSDYLQFEEPLPQTASVPEASENLSQTLDAPETPSALDAPKGIGIKNMDLLYDQVSYDNNPQETAEFEMPESVIVESVRSMILEPEGSAPRGKSPKNGFEEITQNTVTQDNGTGYQLSEIERQLIEENKKFFESGPMSPQEINPIMIWSQKMSESYSTPEVAESPLSPEPPVGNSGELGTPITELDSLVGEFEQFDNDELVEAEKHEQDAPSTM